MKPGQSWAEIPEYNAIPALFHISLTEGSHDIPIEEFLLMTLIPVNGAAFLPVLVPGNILLPITFPFYSANCRYTANFFAGLTFFRFQNHHCGTFLSFGQLANAFLPILVERPHIVTFSRLAQLSNA